MKIKQKPVYEAFDGTEFETEKECRDHERANVARRLAGLADEQIAAALSGADPDLGEAFEKFGDGCRDARLERGGHNRRPKAAAANDEGSAPASIPAEASEPAAVAGEGGE